MNLLQETRDSMRYWNLSTEDIIFIGSIASGHRCTWDDYLILADVNYDNGRGAPEIAIDLVIVFKNGGQLYRWELQGNEGWSYEAPTFIPTNSHKITCLTAPKDTWSSLAKINKEI